MFNCFSVELLNQKSIGESLSTDFYSRINFYIADFHLHIHSYTLNDFRIVLIFFLFTRFIFVQTTHYHLHSIALIAINHTNEQKDAYKRKKKYVREYIRYSNKWMNNQHEYEYEYNFFCKKWINMNEYICECDYEYFRFRIHYHSVLFLARAWNYLSASDTYSVFIQRVFSYNLDLFISNRNHLTTDTIRKITFCLRAWLKFRKLYQEENKNYCWYFQEMY